MFLSSFCFAFCAYFHKGVSGQVEKVILGEKRGCEVGRNFKRPTALRNRAYCLNFGRTDPGSGGRILFAMF